MTSSRLRRWDERKIERASDRGFNKVLRESRRIAPLNHRKVKVRGREETDVSYRSAGVFMSHHKGSAHQRCPGLAALICKVHVGARTSCANTAEGVRRQTEPTSPLNSRLGNNIPASRTKSFVSYSHDDTNGGVGGGGHVLECIHRDRPEGKT